MGKILRNNKIAAILGALALLTIVWFVILGQTWPLGRATYTVDPTSLDHSITGNGQTVKGLLTTIGPSKRATLYFRHTGQADQTLYPFLSSYNASAYSKVRFEFEEGAMLAPAAAVTLPSPSNIKASSFQQIISGTSLFFANPGKISFEMWGADNTGATDSYLAMQAAADCVKAGDDGTDYFQGSVIVLKDGGRYRTDTMWFIGNSAANKGVRSIIVENGGRAVIDLHTTGTIGIDWTGIHAARHMEGVTINGDATDTPTIGLLLARRTSLTSAGILKMDRVNVWGTYSVAMGYNYSAETVTLNNCDLRGIAPYCWYDTASNDLAIVLPNSTATGEISNTDHFFNETYFMNHAAAGTALACVRMGSAYRVSLKNCLLDGSTAGDIPLLWIKQEAAGAQPTNIGVYGTTFHSTFDIGILLDGNIQRVVVDKSSKFGTSVTADIVGKNGRVTGLEIDANTVDFSDAGQDIAGQSILRVRDSINVASLWEGVLYAPSTCTVTIGAPTLAVFTWHITDTGEIRRNGDSSTSYAPSGLTNVRSYTITKALNFNTADTQTLWSYTLADEETIAVRAYVSCKRAATEERGFYGKAALAYRDGGGAATIQTAEVDIFTEIESAAGLDAAIGIDTTAAGSYIFNYTSGSEAPVVGNVLVGAISTEQATVVSVPAPTTGSWAGGDAAGVIYVIGRTGAFAAEDLDISGGTANVMSIGADASPIDVIVSVTNATAAATRWVGRIEYSIITN